MISSIVRDFFTVIAMFFSTVNYAGHEVRIISELERLAAEDERWYRNIYEDQTETDIEQTVITGSVVFTGYLGLDRAAEPGDKESARVVPLSPIISAQRAENTLIGLPGNLNYWRDRTIAVGAITGGIYVLNLIDTWAFDGSTGNLLRSTPIISPASYTLIDTENGRVNFSYTSAF